MEERIQINGIWYIREDAPAESKETKSSFNETNVCTSLEYAYENDSYCYVASIDLDEGGFRKYKDQAAIKFTDKRCVPWGEEYWDNIAWFHGVLDDAPDSIKSLLEIKMTVEDIETFQDFLKYLRDKKEWV
jgi:hypothetical protein